MYDTNEEARLAIVEEISSFLYQIEGVEDDNDASEDLRDQIREETDDYADELVSRALNLDVVAVNPDTGAITVTINLMVTPDQHAAMKADPSLTLDDFPAPTDAELAELDRKIAELIDEK
jgi:hypothetical protein